MMLNQIGHISMPTKYLAIPFTNEAGQRPGFVREIARNFAYIILNSSITLNKLKAHPEGVSNNKNSFDFQKKADGMFSMKKS